MPAANFIDLTGQVFGRLTVLERHGSAPNGSALWLCQCSCGNLSIVLGTQLRGGYTKSCGCLGQEKLLLGRQPKHFGSQEPLYDIWTSMKSRCYNPNNKSYNIYGGRGINVCDDWYNDYSIFRDWSLNHGYEKGLSIDRINTDGNYEPNNCKWSTIKEQANNRRTNINITYFNETHTLSEWCDILNLPYRVIYKRYHTFKWDFWTAISTPLPDHYYEDCYDYDYEGYIDPYEYDNYIYDE